MTITGAGNCLQNFCKLQILVDGKEEQDIAAHAL